MYGRGYVLDDQGLNERMILEWILRGWVVWCYTFLCSLSAVLNFWILDIWLSVHHSITFSLLPTWYTNFLFIYTNYIKLNSSTCFERNPLIIGRSTTQIVHMQPLVSSLSASDRLVQPLRKVAQDSRLQRVMIPEAAYVQFASSTSRWWADCARNM